MNKKINFGIIGTGAIAQVHADALKLIPGAVLTTVYDSDLEKAKNFAMKNSCGYSSSPAEFLASDIAAVTIATPSGAHCESAVAAANAGKHIFCEKPLEISVERTNRIIDACVKNNVLLAPVFQARYGTSVQRAKEAVARGRLGDPVLASASIRWFRSGEYYRNGGWRGTWAMDGGGALMNQGIHTLDLLLYFCGMPVEITGRCANRMHKNIEVEDTVAALLVFGSGCIGTVEASTACAPGFPKRIELSGTGGSIIIEDDRITRWQFTEELPEDEDIRRQGLLGEGLQGGSGNPAAITCEGHRRQLADFAEAIRSGSQLQISPAEGRNAVEVICAIYRSSEEKSTIIL